MRHNHVSYGRRIDPAKLPTWLRPKLKRGQVFDLAMAHNVNLDAITKGEADETILWQFAGGALTWSAIAETLRQRSPERYGDAAAAMAEQLLVARAMVDRFRISGAIRFEGSERDAVREATEWSDALADVIDQPAAAAAAEWSQRRIDRAVAGGAL